VSQNETSGLRLDEYQMQMNNVSTQAMLLLGFVLAFASPAVFEFVADSSGIFCMYKSSLHFGLVSTLLVCTCGCLCMCLLVIFGAAYVVTQGQHAYLHVGWLAAVYRTRQSVVIIYRWYAMALLLFLVSVVLLIWAFVGLPHYVDYPTDEESSALPDDALDSEIVITRSGQRILKCLDVTIDEHRRRQELYGSALASMSTAVFFVASVYGWRKLVSSQTTMEKDSIDPELLVLRRREEQEQNTWQRKEREVTHFRKEDQLAATLNGSIPDPSIIGVQSDDVRAALREATRARERWEEALRQLALRREVEKHHRSVGHATFQHMKREAQQRVSRRVKEELRERAAPPRCRDAQRYVVEVEERERATSGFMSARTPGSRQTSPLPQPCSAQPHPTQRVATASTSDRTGRDHA
jgi:hypothetical protein